MIQETIDEPIEKTSNIVKIYKNLTELNIETLDLKNPIIIKENDEIKNFCESSNEILIQTPIVSIMKSLYDCNEMKCMNINLQNEILSDLILEIDNTLISKIQNNFKKWFNKKINFESILENFIPTKLYTTEIQSYMVLSVPYENNKLNIDIYNNNQELLENPEIEINTNCNCIIQFEGIYLEKTKFYTNWKLIQLKI